MARKESPTVETIAQVLHPLDPLNDAELAAARLAIFR